MKRYLLFSGTDYEYGGPGGWEDFDNSYDSIGDAVSAVHSTPTGRLPRHTHWWHVVDTVTGEIVKRYPE